MSLRSATIHMIVKQWGHEAIQQHVIADDRVPQRDRIERVINILNILRCNDVAYNMADSFEKDLKLMKHMDL